MIGGVELNPGPDGYKDTYLKEAEKEIADICQMLNKMREHTKVDRQHSYERVHQNEERDRRDELESQQPILPNRSNSAATRNQTRIRRKSNEPCKIDKERRKRNIILLGFEAATE